MNDQQDILIAIWKDWEARDDFTCILLRDGRKYVWAFGVLFSRKTCNVRASESEVNHIKREYLNGYARFESSEFEERRQDYFLLSDAA